jgi:hypothetical protein
VKKLIGKHKLFQVTRDTYQLNSNGRTAFMLKARPKCSVLYLMDKRLYLPKNLAGKRVEIFLKIKEDAL